MKKDFILTMEKHARNVQELLILVWTKLSVRSVLVGLIRRKMKINAHHVMISTTVLQRLINPLINLLINLQTKVKAVLRLSSTTQRAKSVNNVFTPMCVQMVNLKLAELAKNRISYMELILASIAGLALLVLKTCDNVKVVPRVSIKMKLARFLAKSARNQEHTLT